MDKRSDCRIACARVGRGIARIQSRYPWHRSPWSQLRIRGRRCNSPLVFAALVVAAIWFANDFIAPLFLNSRIERLGEKNLPKILTEKGGTIWQETHKHVRSAEAKKFNPPEF